MARAPRLPRPLCSVPALSPPVDPDPLGEQRDYTLGITSLWMLVPSAHALSALVHGPSVSEVLADLSWKESMFFLDGPEFEACRLTVLGLLLIPTCTVSVASWRWPDHDRLAETDRFCARMLFIGLIGYNLPGYGPLAGSEALLFPAVTLSLYGGSAVAEWLGEPTARAWVHAAFRCGGYWWTYASLNANGFSGIEPWYFGSMMAIYWAHVAWCMRSSRRDPRFRSADHYARGCALVAGFALLAAAASPCDPLFLRPAPAASV